MSTHSRKIINNNGPVQNPDSTETRADQRLRGTRSGSVLDLFFSHASNGATFTELDRQHLYRIKYHQADPDTLDEEVTAA